MQRGDFWRDRRSDAPQTRSRALQYCRRWRTAAGGSGGRFRPPSERATTNFARKWRKRPANFPGKLCATKSGTAFAKSLFYHQSEFGDEAGYKKLAERLDQLDKETRHARQSPFLLRGSRQINSNRSCKNLKNSRTEQGARRKLGARHLSRSHSALISSPRGTSIGSSAMSFCGRSNLSDRSLPRERDRAEHFGAAFRERDLRAALEHALHRSRPDHRRGNAWAWKTAPVITKAPAPCATWCRIILLQLLCLVAMEPPTDLRRRQHSRRKVKVVRSTPSLRRKGGRH